MYTFRRTVELEIAWTTTVSGQRKRSSLERLERYIEEEAAKDRATDKPLLTSFLCVLCWELHAGY